MRIWSKMMRNGQDNKKYILLNQNVMIGLSIRVYFEMYFVPMFPFSHYLAARI